MATFNGEEPFRDNRLQRQCRPGDAISGKVKHGSPASGTYGGKAQHSHQQAQQQGHT